jgi:hypothetical protein
VDEVVERLGTRNNGLYTNEWLIGDGKNNEIAMYELGTGRTKLWRSSKNEWFGGTEGFYWGDNNAKDLQVRLEYVPIRKACPSSCLILRTGAIERGRISITSIAGRSTSSSDSWHSARRRW